jgi:hypothetical protein
LKAAIKSMLTAAGHVIQRLPAGLPAGHHLSRDLRLVVGGQPGSLAIDVGAHVGDFVDLLIGALAAQSLSRLVHRALRAS